MGDVTNIDSMINILNTIYESTDDVIKALDENPEYKDRFFNDDVDVIDLFN